MKFSLYSKTSKRIIRIITLISILIISISTIFHIINRTQETDILLVLFQNSFSLILATLFFIFPTKLILLSLITFQYSIVSFIYEPKDIMGLLMFVLSLLILDIRGFFVNHKKIKLYTIFLISIIINMTELRFGLTIFLTSIIYKAGHIFVFSLIVLYFIFKEKNNLYSKSSDLNLANYPSLKKRDAEWLIHIQQNHKYDFIAIEYEMSLGSVKNRLKLIFDTLEVGDKAGFLNKYSSSKIYYDEN